MTYFELMQQQITVNTMMPELLISDEFVTTIDDDKKVSAA